MLTTNRRSLAFAVKQPILAGMTTLYPLSVRQRQLGFQLLALLPLLVCTIGLFGAEEMTPRWALGLLTYGAVSLSYIAGTLDLAGRFRLLPLLIPLVGWQAQLAMTEVGLGLLAITALMVAIFPLRANPWRIFGAGAALLLAIAAVKLRSYGFY